MSRGRRESLEYKETRIRASNAAASAFGPGMDRDVHAPGILGARAYRKKLKVPVRYALEPFPYEVFRENRRPSELMATPLAGWTRTVGDFTRLFFLAPSRDGCGPK